jgi:hypothetical protein
MCDAIEHDIDAVRRRRTQANCRHAKQPIAETAIERHEAAFRARPISQGRGSEAVDQATEKVICAVGQHSVEQGEQVVSGCHIVGEIAWHEKDLTIAALDRRKGKGRRKDGGEELDKLGYSSLRKIRMRL